MTLCFLNMGLRHKFFPQRYASIRNLTSSAEEKLGPGDIEDVDQESKIQKVCDKSRLKTEHRNILFDQRPYSEPMTKAHTTVLYNRKLYGRYGQASGVNLGIMWPTKSDLTNQKEYERIAFPHTIKEMVDNAKLVIEEKEKEKQEIENRIKANMAKLDMWKKQLRDTIAKREAEAIAAKQKKEKLMEEVRRHFGFTVDVRDERFKEMLALKEKEMKKKEKQARSEEREKKALAKLLENYKSSETET